MGKRTPTMTWKKVLMPTDFSEASRAALPHAIGIAKEMEASLTLVHVVPSTTPADITLHEAGLRQLVEAELTRWRKEIPGLKEQINEILVRTGSVSFEILQAALLLNSDLIIMATHARKGLKRLALGSNAEKVVRHARCPVLIFPARK